MPEIPASKLELCVQRKSRDDMPRPFRLIQFSVLKCRYKTGMVLLRHVALALLADLSLHIRINSTRTDRDRGNVGFFHRNMSGEGVYSSLG
jgi:hypothetical protein